MHRLFALFVLWFSQSSCYTIEQAYHFNNAFNSRVRVDGALSAKELSPDLRHKLELSRQVLTFARSQGLNTGDAYQHFIPEANAQVSHLVQAAYADRLEAVTWWFPVVGTVPYLGYFEKERRDAKAESLRRQGYDVSLGSVGAFSSLGWFDDPIYASMMKRSDEEFVQMILHELVHRSFWSKGSVTFNENLAEFVSIKLTQVFLEENKAGAGIEGLKLQREDQVQVRRWLESMKSALQDIYVRNDLSHDEKLREKNRVIAEFKEQKFPALKTSAYTYWKLKDWNNASILGASLYSPDIAGFERAAGCLGAFQAGRFLDDLKTAEKQAESADLALEKMCSSSFAAARQGH